MKLSKCCVSIVLALTVSVIAQSKKDESAPISRQDAAKLKSPIPFTKKSIARGRGMYARLCVACHGADGKATVDVVANATDLTTPKAWKNGYTEGEIFRSIRDGLGSSMPAFNTQISQDDMWHIVNFVRSLWPDSMKPPLQETDIDNKDK
jgi:cytochrome c